MIVLAGLIICVLLLRAQLALCTTIFAGNATLSRKVRLSFASSPLAADGDWDVRRASLKAIHENCGAGHEMPDAYAGSDRKEYSEREEAVEER